MTIETQKPFTVILENYEGGCKRVKVMAFNAEDAMAKFMFGKWIAVGIQ